MIKTFCIYLLLFLIGTCFSVDPEAREELLDLSRASLVVASPSNSLIHKSAEVLRDEVFKRTGIQIAIEETRPEGEDPVILLGTVGSAPKELGNLPDGIEVPAEPEGYAIWVDSPGADSPTVRVLGSDERGVLFGVGKVLRLLRMEVGKIGLPADVALETAPEYPIRGHQLGYRETANSYDAWDLEVYEQYIRDLAVFGTNGIELITSLDPTWLDGRAMMVPQWEMNLKLAELVHSYGLDVWFWMPLEGDVTDPKVSEKEIEDRRKFFRECVAIDHVMVPGGDPGRTTPTVLMPWLEEMVKVLHESHPNAKLWVSNQKFKPEENNVFFDYLQQSLPEWLEGVVYGPGTLITLQETRERTPKKYKLRRYPDITHNIRCEFPVPELDGILAQTLGREGINPRPQATSHIHNLFAPLSDGFVSYSDGIHDDLNKMIWSSLGWDSKTAVEDTLLEYGRYFFGERVAKDVAKGMGLLEANLKGKVCANDGIEKALDQWLEIERKGGKGLQTNWRFQMHLFRACFDAYIRTRHLAEMEYQEEAYAALARAGADGVPEAIRAAREALAKADEVPPRRDLRLRIEELGVALLRSIGFQLSAEEPYRAKSPERGALLDKVDRPVNDRLWLEAQFEEILATPDNEERLAMVDRILNWEDPGPGGFYDDLGCAWKQPHLVRQTTWTEDPSFILGPQESHYRSMDNSTGVISPLKYSWLDQVETVYGVPLQMRYENLDPKAAYRVRVTYFGRYGSPMRLVADGKDVIHEGFPRPDPVWPVEFDVPLKATEDGALDLSWELVSGRGCQVAEVWLLRK